MELNALLLDRDWRPFKVVSWKRAIMLLLDGRADVQEVYEGRSIHSVNASWDVPAVMTLRQKPSRTGRCRFNRINVFARDKFACQYCGMTPMKGGRVDLASLELEHLVPRRQSKDAKVYLPWSKKVVPVTCWQNIVASCRDCNARKGGRDPFEANMIPKRWPGPPTSLDLLRLQLARVAIPTEWHDYLPEDWRDYWVVELDQD